MTTQESILTPTSPADSNAHPKPELSGTELKSGVSTCGNPKCKHLAGGFESKGKDIVFAGQTLCSAVCLTTMLKECLAEEHRISENPLTAHPSLLIGQILVDQGFVTVSQLDRALQSQRGSGELLGECLKRQMLLSHEDFTAALSIQWQCPVYRTGAFVPERMATFVPRPIVESLGALPLRVNHNPERLTIAFIGRTDLRIMAACERMHGIPVDGGLLIPDEMKQATSRLLESSFAPCRVVRARSRQRMLEGMVQAILDHAPRDSRLVFVRGYFWLRMWSGEKFKPTDILSRLGGNDLSAPSDGGVEELW
jgi:hypothetical protein